MGRGVVVAGGQSPPLLLGPPPHFHVGAGGWVEGRRVVAAVQLVGARVRVVWLLWVAGLGSGVRWRRWESVWDHFEPEG